MLKDTRWVYKNESYFYTLMTASLVAQMITYPPAMREIWVQSLGWEDSLDEGMATHSRILAWRIPMVRGAWWATVHGVPKSWTWLSPLRAPGDREQQVQVPERLEWEEKGLAWWTEDGGASREAKRIQGVEGNIEGCEGGRMSGSGGKQEVSEEQDWTDPQFPTEVPINISKVMPARKQAEVSRTYSHMSSRRGFQLTE